MGVDMVEEMGALGNLVFGGDARLKVVTVNYLAEVELPRSLRFATQKTLRFGREDREESQ